MAEQIPGPGAAAGPGPDQWPTLGAGLGAGLNAGPSAGLGAGPSTGWAEGPEPDGYRLAAPRAAAVADGYPLAAPRVDEYPLTPPQAADGYVLAPPVNPPVPHGPYPAYPAFPPPMPPMPPAPPTTPVTAAPVVPPKRPGAGARRAVGVGAIAALVVAAAAGVTALVVSGGGGSGSPSGGGTATPVASGLRQLKQAWVVPNSAGQADTHLYGGWVTGSYAIRVDQSGVTAYRLGNGGRAWRAAMPKGDQPCAMSPTLSAGGVATVGFGGASECQVLIGLDTATGRTLWTRPLTKPGDTLGVFAQTYVQGSVATLISPALITGLDVSTGKPVWTYHPRGQFCDVYPNGTTGAVLVSDFCAAANPGYSLTSLNPLTGRTEWSRSETGDINFGSVLSGHPLAATVESGAGEKPYLFDSGGGAKPINTPSGTATTPDAFDDSTPAQVVGGNLVAQSAGEIGGQDATGGMIDAFATATGDRAWSYSGEGGYGAQLLAPVADGSLNALSTGAILGTPELVRLNPATGRSTVLAAVSVGTSWDVSTDQLFTAPGGGLVVFGTMNDPAVGLFR
ncbi:PQQ-binding-like beta-propeller repeat protein [Streptacidiphilus sp. P02-A3a]|uniref:outer membrane protein assembly factor BamB family protein n=1 Tax=Streptacidiphilus sp. P02-A3a TaxID=2704468 RepID=UPI0015FD3B2C|nr:PQQ-binding-like beta-propeller repeat protein [Streptacidiphilus sp. P02-A3a]QMU68101.1 PQQ-binding-like beta-propeller repeat protein [Streptacidiphilus sp. P02-A3a]